MRLINHVHACLEEIEGRSSSWLALSQTEKRFHASVYIPDPNSTFSRTRYLISRRENVPERTLRAFFVFARRCMYIRASILMGKLLREKTVI